MVEMNEKLKSESEQCSRLRKQVNEMTVLMTTKEQSLTEKVNHLQTLKDTLELDVAKMNLALEKQENVRHQVADMQIELENRTQTLQTELEKTRERETRLLEDNKSFLNKLVEAEKASTSLELQLKALSAKYEQEVKAIHTEMERRSPADDKEDQMKCKLYSFLIYLCKFVLKYIFFIIHVFYFRRT